jgi:hypothetical protein
MPSAVSTFACALWRLRFVMVTISGSVRIILCSRWTQRTTTACSLTGYLHCRSFSKLTTTASQGVEWPCRSLALIIACLSSLRTSRWSQRAVSGSPEPETDPILIYVPDIYVKPSPSALPADLNAGWRPSGSKSSRAEAVHPWRPVTTIHVRAERGRRFKQMSRFWDEEMVARDRWSRQASLSQLAVTQIWGA